MIEFIFAHPGLTIAAFMLLEKAVKLSPAKWDDILVDGLKALYKSTKNK